MSEDRILIPGDIYKHFKNKLYQIITIAIHSETGERYVVYQALYDDFNTYIRPYEMFISEVDRIKYPEVTQKYRFEKVEKINNSDNAGHVNSFKTAPEEEKTVESDTGVNPILLEFFDKNSLADKIEYLNSVKSKINDRLINDISASLDLTIEEGDVSIRFASLINCLQTMARFECQRLR